MSRREHLSILIDTLRELEHARKERDEVSLTRLAARINVPFDRFQANIAELQTRALVSMERPYLPTPKGTALLGQLDMWKAALRDAGLVDTHAP